MKKISSLDIYLVNSEVIKLIELKELPDTGRISVRRRWVDRCTGR